MKLVTPKKLAASLLWKFIYQVPEGTQKSLPSDFTQVSIIKCCLHNLFSPRCLIPRLELTNSEALFIDNMSPKVSIPTLSTEKIKQHRLKALKCKRKQAEDRAKKKVEKDVMPKKKAKATKCNGLEMSNTVVPEGPSEPSSERPVSFLHPSLTPLLKY